MTGELGQLSLCFALALSLVMSVAGIAGVGEANATARRIAHGAAMGFTVFILLAFGVLTCAFLGSDFSVSTVAQYSTTLQPLVYKVSAVWSNHEGSMLLWMLILNVWTVAVAAFSRRLPDDFIARVIAVLGFIAFGFLLFTALTSNPFERALPMPFDGNDLNPVLQDPGLIVHPPMLYTGYVGFSVAFAFALAALIGGELDVRWVRWAPSGPPVLLAIGRSVPAAEVVMP